VKTQQTRIRERPDALVAGSDPKRNTAHQPAAQAAGRLRDRTGQPVRPRDCNPYPTPMETIMNKLNNAICDLASCRINVADIAYLCRVTSNAVKARLADAGYVIERGTNGAITPTMGFSQRVRFLTMAGCSDDTIRTALRCGPADLRNVRSRKAYQVFVPVYSEHVQALGYSRLSDLNAARRNAA
jgi:hypothetical protein